jgi:outer membrane lipoprotein-sorting protein
VSGPRRPSSAVFFVLVSLLAGCVAAVAPPRQSVPEDARRAVALLAGRWQGFSDLRALSDITVEQGGRRDRLAGVLLAKAPASVRFEVLSPFGQPLYVATIHEGRLVAYDAVANEATVGPATAETAGRLLKLPFEPEALVGILAALAVPPDDLRTAEILKPDEAGPSLSMVGPVNEQRVWMDLQTGVVRQIQITGGRFDARVTYHRDASGLLRGFDLAAAQNWITGTVRYRDLVIDGGIPPDRFVFSVPKGARTRELR